MAGNGVPVQGENYDGQNCETSREEANAKRSDVIKRSVNALAAAALACSLNMTNPQEAQAQETYTIQPAILYIPKPIQASEGVSLEERQALRERIVQDVLFQEQAGTGILEGEGIPDNLKAIDVIRAIYMYGDDALIVSFEGFFAATQEESTEAAVVIYPKLSDEILSVVRHSEAIDLGRQEVFFNMKQDPDLEGLEDSDYAEYRDEIFNAFIRGIDDGTLSEFIRYTPAFTQYAITFPDDFPLAEELAKEADIVIGREIIAQENARQAELEAKQEAGRETIAQENARQAELEARQEAGRETIAELEARQEALERLRIALQGGA